MDTKREVHEPHDEQRDDQLNDQLNIRLNDRMKKQQALKDQEVKSHGELNRGWELVIPTSFEDSDPNQEGNSKTSESFKALGIRGIPFTLGKPHPETLDVSIPIIPTITNLHEKVENMNDFENVDSPDSPDNLDNLHHLDNPDQDEQEDGQDDIVDSIDQLESSVKNLEHKLQLQRIKLVKAKSRDLFLAFCHVSSPQAEGWLRSQHQPEVFLLESSDDGPQKSYFALLKMKRWSVDKTYHTDPCMDMEWEMDRDEIRKEVNARIDEDVAVDVFKMVTLEGVMDDAHWEKMMGFDIDPLWFLYLRFCLVFSKYVENDDEISLGCTHCTCPFHYKEYWNFACINLQA